VNDSFNWWLLIVGLVVGAGLVWLVLADTRRREADLEDLERRGEARWIAEAMADAGRPVPEEHALDILRLHAAYLAASPPDELDSDGTDEGLAERDPDRWIELPAGDRRPGAADRAGAAERRAMAHPISPSDAAGPGSGPA
jgi:hypothetical protein